MAKNKPEPVKAKPAASAAPAAPAAVTRKYAAGKIVATAQDVYTDIIRKNARPTMRFPIRSLSNVKYDPKKGHFEILKKVATRTLSYNTFLQYGENICPVHAPDGHDQEGSPG